MDIFLSTLVKFWYTMLIVFILSRFLYYRYQGKKEILFTLILLSAIISFLCILISRVELSLGFALGIFAIFGIIRYRTVQVTPREMTYLFLSAGTAAKNILAPDDMEFHRLVISDLSILILAALAEYFLFRRKDCTKHVLYNNLDLIHPDKRIVLEKELKDRFGISEIQKIKVGDINTAKKTADLLVYFKDSENNNFNK